MLSRTHHRNLAGSKGPVKMYIPSTGAVFHSPDRIKAIPHMIYHYHDRKASNFTKLQQIFKVN
jgi:hypothetical protein